MRFEDDSVESAKNVKQWNVKIISVSFFWFSFLSCFLDPSFVEVSGFLVLVLSSTLLFFVSDV